MSSEFNKRFADFLVSCPDVIEEDNDNGYGVTDYASQSKESQILPYKFMMEQHLRQCNDDTSTLSSTNISDSIFESSTDHNDYESQLEVKTNAFQLQNIGQSIRGSNENPGKISIEHSSDVLFGSKTFFTGPVVIKQFIAESDAANANLKEEYSDVLHTSEIGNDFPFNKSVSMMSK